MTAGRKPLHPNVHRLRGNASKKSVAELASGLSPAIELPKAPGHLSSAARAEYLRLGRALVELGVMTKLDRGVLAMMAVEWARHAWAEERIAALNVDDPTGDKGLIDHTPNGFAQQSVYLQISRKGIEIYHKLAADYGLTPAARQRVQPGLGQQMSLPGIQDPEKPSLQSFA